MPKESNEGESIDKAPSSKITITANIEYIISAPRLAVISELI
jgi:hypothetical protein